MARSHSFWLIVDGEVPTSFRAREREDLLPTLHQLQRTQPNVALLWFERGRTWTSPEAAREDQEQRRREARERKADWRPGGAHVDPRAKYQLTRDQKRARFKKRAAFQRDDDRDRPAGGPPRPDERRPLGRRPPRPFGTDFRPSSRPGRPPDARDRPDGTKRPWRPKGPPSAKRPWRPKGPPAGDRPWRPKGPPSAKSSWRPSGSRPQGQRPPGRSPWKPRGPRGPRGPKGGR